MKQEVKVRFKNTESSEYFLAHANTFIDKRPVGSNCSAQNKKLNRRVR